MKGFFDFWRMLARDREDGGGSGGDAGAAGGGLAAAAAAAVAEAEKNNPAAKTGEGGGGDPAAAPAAGQPYFPADFPDQWKGTSDNETIDKLYGALNGLPKPPEKAEDYKLDLPKEFTDKFGDIKDDAVLGLWRNVAHKNGLSDAQFQASLVDLYGELDKVGLIDNGPDFAAEFEKLKPKGGDTISRIKEAARRANDAEAWVSSLALKDGQQGGEGLRKSQVALLAGLLDTAEGVETIEYLRGLGAKQGLTSGGQRVAGGEMTDHERTMRAMYPSMFKS